MTAVYDDPSTEEPNLLAQIITAAELHHEVFPDLVQFVHGIVIEGFGIVAGPPKLGKSWWTLNLALAVSAGGRAFGKIPVEQRDVLLLALEDSQRRLQSRIRAVWGSDIPPHRLHILTSVQPGLLIPTITTWLQTHPGGLIVLDTLGRARQQRRRGDDAYLADYQAGVALKNVVDAFPGSALLSVHHTRKASSDDFVDDLSGTLGLAGSADYVLVLRRQRNSNDATLQVTGRDAPEGEYAFSTAEGAWTLSGNGLAEAAAEAESRKESRNLGDNALKVLAYVNEHPSGVTPEAVAEHLGINNNDAGTYLRRLHSKGRIDRPTRGFYTPVCVSEVSELSETTVHPIDIQTQKTLQTPLCAVCECVIANPDTAPTWNESTYCDDCSETIDHTLDELMAMADEEPNG
ncbi:AAA family ATPase [Mycobacterium sp. SMC-8]|uniref:AAA family ATPase n=1 Tax=Mycobacterium sp. SMC-8 TaxID=2857060 RepID=UPI0021B3DBDD|nr:AAA family ATPase [Mycobacterium sp. SMC-8]UXA10371.1 AAA family ATPase [Mycobacterium sp. SMC-8]